MKAINTTRQQRLGDNIKVAANFFSRLVGLLATPRLQAGAGLLIKPCNSVHTFGMRYPIDVVFVDSSHTVVKVVSGLKPCRLAAVRGAAYVIELPEGMASATFTQKGDKLEIIN
ncbi:DUF192 domain-containing protein [Sporomusa malonica]|uniref:DUF192 domain-containing protein n=1 Tax=Sporomusa malonica TaxID=112901 RepID=A0A1W2BG17_9FIRM|nr:DUF192 domain-containing protein [Sporomusa malonica]SMC71859.1 hypothetical protein SAMN04488500_107158 [Sporomusa malonica]